MNDQAAQPRPVVVELPAEIDTTNAEAVYEQLLAVLAPGVATVIADMMSTTFCDSAGVHALMRAHEASAARGVLLRAAVPPEGSVRRVLQLIGVGRVMPVHPSLEEALHPA